ncbi:MAG: indole-3-glycerol phosphate synthase TrpC [Rickettsiales bacterium]
MTNTLTKICADKKQHIEKQKSIINESELYSLSKTQTTPRGFKKALAEKIANGKPALIAEIKKASPSKGLIRTDFNPEKLAEAYDKGGATCLSVLTDIPYFQGSDEYLKEARNATNLPLLRKDFMLEPYQIVESRAIGADCILLIMAALSDKQAQELESLSSELGMDTLVEIHNKKELDRALAINPDNVGKIIGINNRNLKTLNVDLTTSEELAKYIPKDYIGICESGISTPADIARMRACGLHAFLVGESLMRQNDVTKATKDLLSFRTQ